MTTTVAAYRPEGVRAVVVVDPGSIPREPSRSLRFKRRLRPAEVARELWAARELILTIAEREYRVRYKQAFLGIAWALLTPLALMAVFTLFFQHVAHVHHVGQPYPLFAYLGLLPWTFFASSISAGGQVMVLNVPLLNKVYCPREVFPIAEVLVAAMDACISLVGLAALFIVYHRLPQEASIWVPVLLAIQVAFTLGMTMLASVLIVHLRDLRYALPIFLQLGLFATPVAYALTDMPAWARPIICTINPIAAVIDGYRTTVLSGHHPNFHLLGLAGASSVCVLVLGYVVFKHLETGIADVA